MRNAPFTRYMIPLQPTYGGWTVLTSRRVYNASPELGLSRLLTTTSRKPTATGDTMDLDRLTTGTKRLTAETRLYATPTDYSYLLPQISDWSQFFS